MEPDGSSAERRLAPMIVLASHAARLALGFVVSLVLARSLPPDEYGIFSVLMGFLMTAAAISDLGINIPFVRFYVQQSQQGDSDADRFAGFAYTSRALLSMVAMAVATTVLIIWGTALLQRAFPLWAILLGSLLVLTEGISSFLLAVLQAQGRFTLLAVLMVSPNVLRTVVLLILVATNSVSLISAFVLFAVSLMITAGATKAALPGLGLRWDYRSAFTQFRHAVAWTRWTAVQTFSNVVMTKFDILALGFYAVEPARIGNYALGLAFASLLNVLQSSTMTILLPRVSALRSVADLRLYRRRIWAIEGALVVGVAASTLAAFGFIEWLYADRYPYAGGLVLILAGAFGVSVLVTPWTLLTYSIDRPQIPAIQNVVGFVILGAAALVFVPQFETSGMAWSVLMARCCSEMTGLVLTTRALRRHPLGAKLDAVGGSE